MGISDHETTILLDMNFHAKKAKPPKCQIFMWNRVNTNLLKNHVSSEVEDFMTNNTTDTYINDIWSNFKRIVATSMELVHTKLVPPPGSLNLGSHERANNIVEENKGLIIEQKELDRRMTGISLKP